MIQLRVVNPLPHALAHYQRELIASLEPAGVDLSIERVESIESLSRWKKLRALTVTFVRRLVGRIPPEGVRLVIWPALGFWDPLIWLAGRGRTFTIYHDPDPLRRQFGYSRLAIWFLRHSRAGGRILCHSEVAARELSEKIGRAPFVVPHPMLAPTAPRQPNNAGTVIRVLGQYKDTRSVDSLDRIRAWAAGRPSPVILEVVGRGWPEVAGWQVRAEFVSESEFTTLIDTSDVVVLPYSRFYQSGVAVRCFESGVPLVSPRHEQVTELYGADWPGTVENGDWGGAIGRALLANPEPRRHAVYAAVSDEWSRTIGALTVVHRSKQEHVP